MGLSLSPWLRETVYPFRHSVEASILRIVMLNPLVALELLVEMHHVVQTSQQKPSQCYPVDGMRALGRIGRPTVASLLFDDHELIQLFGEEAEVPKNARASRPLRARRVQARQRSGLTPTRPIFRGTR